MVGSKRARPWNRQPRSTTGSASAAAAAAAAFTLAAFSVSGARAFSLQVRSPRPSSYAGTEIGACSNAARRSTTTRTGAGRREHSGPYCVHLQRGSCPLIGGVGSSGHLRPSSPVVSAHQVDIDVDDRSSPKGGGVHDTAAGGAAAPAVAVESVASATATMEEAAEAVSRPSDATKKSEGSGRQAAAAAHSSPLQSSVMAGPTAYDGTKVGPPTRSGNSNGAYYKTRRRWRPSWYLSRDSSNNNRIDSSGARSNNTTITAAAAADILPRHTRSSDNDVRMFFLERGLSQEDVRKVLPVMRRDPNLMSYIGMLAARMQVGTAA